LRGKFKAWGVVDAGTSSTTSNEEIAATSMRPKGFGGARAFAALALLDDGPHQLHRAAWHLSLRRSEPSLLYFYQGLLAEPFGELR